MADLERIKRLESAAAVIAGNALVPAAMRVAAADLVAGYVEVEERLMLLERSIQELNERIGHAEKTAARTD
jgi:hypothetical protein